MQIIFGSFENKILNIKHMKYFSIHIRMNVHVSRPATYLNVFNTHRMRIV